MAVVGSLTEIEQVPLTFGRYKYCTAFNAKHRFSLFCTTATRPGCLLDEGITCEVWQVCIKKGQVYSQVERSL